MFRRILLGLSLFLSVLALAAWVRTYWRLDLVVWTKPGAQVELIGHRGRLGITYREGNFPARDAFGLRHESVPANRAINRPRGETGLSWRLGARFGETGPAGLDVVFPFWLPVAAFAVSASAFCLSHVLANRRRRTTGLCMGCEYDLTGNQTGICPECGVSIDVHSGTGRRHAARFASFRNLLRRLVRFATIER